MLRRLTAVFASALLATALVPGLAAGTPASTPTPLDTLDQAPQAGTSLEEGVGLVHAATGLQAERAGLHTVQPVALDDASLEEAVRSLFAQHGATPGPAVLDEIDRIEHASPPVADSLARLVAAFAHLGQVTQATFPAPADPVEVGSAGSPADVWRHQGLDPAPALAARSLVLDATADLDAAIDASKTTPDVTLSAPPVLGLDLAGQDTVYPEDMALVVDVGGDDTYRNNAGGTAGAGAAALVDLGGEDVHGQPQLAPHDRRQGINGGGLNGVGILVDDGTSDDVYAGYADGVNGGAFAGVGLLLDAGGDDRYTAEGWGANGGGYPGGIAQLVDLSGHDSYTGSYEAVNGGALLGSGLLYDGSGSDVYEATSFGTNGGAFAGQGLLVDRGDGDDRYEASQGNVNGGALGGPGLLFDEGGTDTYVEEDGVWQDRTVLPKGAAGAQVDR